MTCEDCAASRTCTGKHRLYSPSCAYCGARLVQQLRDQRCTQAEIKQRQQAMLEVWAKFHPMAELLALIAGPLAFEPVKKEKK
jgi:hypothetical protein